MNFKIMVTHSSCPNIEKQLFAKVVLPDSIHVGGGKWIESRNDGLPEEIIKALNDNQVRDCVFTIAEKNNQSQAMQKYWKRRKLSEKNLVEFGPHSQSGGNP
jgi:hypothetical protein